MDISKWAFKNRNLVYFLVTVLLVGGILSCYQMSKLEDPEIKVKLAMVVYYLCRRDQNQYQNESNQRTSRELCCFLHGRNGYRYRASGPSMFAQSQLPHQWSRCCGC